MISTKTAGSDPAPRPKRRTFSPEYKLRIVAEHDATPKNEKGAIARSEQLHHSHVKEWWAVRDAGALEKMVDKRTSLARPKNSDAEAEGEKLRRQAQRLEKELERNEAALEVMGKYFRDLGNDPRGHGLMHAVDPVAVDAFADVERALDVTAACRLTGRSLPQAAAPAGAEIQETASPALGPDGRRAGPAALPALGPEDLNRQGD
ncbi:transposase [Streptomyces tailanensis]|uniref:transposase n=1 Tax=Streptomyces tailanensis TaxID=2569858 RepID=UPI00122DFF63|nr:transposase [Streptomyces tailanensis]